MLPTVHLKDEVEPEQVLLTLNNLLHNMIKEVKP